MVPSTHAHTHTHMCVRTNINKTMATSLAQHKECPGRQRGWCTYLFVHAPPTHSQSPLHHLAPLPCGHKAQVAARWLPQLTFSLAAPMHLSQSPLALHEVQPVDLPLAPQHRPFLQVPLVQSADEEQVPPSPDNATQVGLLVPPQLPLSFLPLGQLVRQRTHSQLER